MSPQSHASPSPAQAARKLSRQALPLHTPSYQFTLLNVSQIQLLLSSCASALVQVLSISCLNHWKSLPIHLHALNFTSFIFYVATIEVV